LYNFFLSSAIFSTVVFVSSCYCIFIFRPCRTSRGCPRSVGLSGSFIRSRRIAPLSFQAILLELPNAFQTMFSLECQ